MMAIRLDHVAIGFGIAFHADGTVVVGLAGFGYDVLHPRKDGSRVVNIKLEANF